MWNLSLKWILVVGNIFCAIYFLYRAMSNDNDVKFNISSIFQNVRVKDSSRTLLFLEGVFCALVAVIIYLFL